MEASGCWRISSPNAATAPSTVRVAKLIATWQLSRIWVGIGVPGGLLGRQDDLDADVTALTDQLLNQPGQLGHAASWPLASAPVPLRSCKNVCASSTTTTTSGQDGGRAEVPCVGHAEDRAKLAWRSTIRPYTCRSTSRTTLRSSLADSHALGNRRS